MKSGLSDPNHIRPLDIEEIRLLVQSACYSVRSHAVAHMFKEGFGEDQVVEAVMTGKVLEEYPKDYRCLIVGYPRLEGERTIPLHVVCDYHDPEWVDIVTAYIPQKPWWDTPIRRGRRG